MVIQTENSEGVLSISWVGDRGINALDIDTETGEMWFSHYDKQGLQGLANLPTLQDVTRYLIEEIDRKSKLTRYI